MDYEENRSQIRRQPPRVMPVRATWLSPSLRLAGHASIAAALGHHAAAQTAHYERSRTARRLGRGPG